MSERRVARVGDKIVCLTHIMSGSQNPGCIGPEPEKREVLVEGRPAAGSGDPCLLCVGSNAVWAGAAAVYVGYSEAPLAGRLHISKHYPGKDGAPGLEGIQTGAGTVIVGGNITIGNVAAATRACKDLAKTRPGYDPQNPERRQATQSENNCGLECECCRQIINTVRAKKGEAPISEDDLFDESLQNEYADVEAAEAKNDEERYKREQKVLNFYEENPDPNNNDVSSAGLYYFDTDHRPYGVKKIALKEAFLKEVERIKKAREERRKNAHDRTLGPDGRPNEDRMAYGWTKPEARKEILKNHGVASHLEDPSLDNIESAIWAGKGVITTHPASALWGDPNIEGNHIVLVSGIEYDEDGHIVKIVYNDTFKGCHKQLDKDTFMASLHPNAGMNVTDEPIW